MLVLDSAGVQGTVSYKSQAVDSILDARTTESLMFDMISRTLGEAQSVYSVQLRHNLYILSNFEYCMAQQNKSRALLFFRTNGYCAARGGSPTT